LKLDLTCCKENSKQFLSCKDKNIFLICAICKSKVGAAKYLQEKTNFVNPSGKILRNANKNSRFAIIYKSQAFMD